MGYAECMWQIVVLAAILGQSFLVYAKTPEARRDETAALREAIKEYRSLKTFGELKARRYPALSKADQEAFAQSTSKISAQARLPRVDLAGGGGGGALMFRHKRAVVSVQLTSVTERKWIINHKQVKFEEFEPLRVRLDKIARLLPRPSAWRLFFDEAVAEDEEDSGGPQNIAEMNAALTMALAAFTSMTESAWTCKRLDQARNTSCNNLPIGLRDPENLDPKIKTDLASNYCKLSQHRDDLREDRKQATAAGSSVDECRVGKSQVSKREMLEECYDNLLQLSRNALNRNEMNCGSGSGPGGSAPKTAD